MTPDMIELFRNGKVEDLRKLKEVLDNFEAKIV